MPYSTTLETVESMLPYLEYLRKGETCTWHTIKGSEAKVQYKLREALFAASANLEAREKYPELADAHEKFEIRAEPGKGMVRARKLPEMEAIEDKELAEEHVPVEMLGVPASFSRMEVQGNQTHFSVVEAVKNNLKHADIIHFPVANLVPAQLEKLYAWAKAREEPLMLIEYDGALTVQRFDERLVDAEWKPEEDAV